MGKKKERKWLLLQARIDLQAGKDLRDLARREGLPASAYVRRLVLQHLEQMKTSMPQGSQQAVTA